MRCEHCLLEGQRERHATSSRRVASSPAVLRVFIANICAVRCRRPDMLNFLESDQDEVTFQLANQAAKRTASGMNSKEVSNTM
jgi:hypothetical protein